MASCHAARSVPTQPRIATAGQAGRQPSGSRTFLFTAEADQPRARPATDLIRLLGSALCAGTHRRSGGAAAGCTASLRVVRSQYPVRAGRTVAAADRVVTLLGVIVWSALSTADAGMRCATSSSPVPLPSGSRSSSPRRDRFVGIGGLDFGLLGKQLSHATWWLVVAGALLVQVTRLTNAISLTSASPETTPLGPVYALKLAMGYVGFAVPAPGARTAVGVRFHQRHGMAAGPPWLLKDWTASCNSVCRRSC